MLVQGERIEVFDDVPMSETHQVSRIELMSPQSNVPMGIKTMISNKEYNGNQGTTYRGRVTGRRAQVSYRDKVQGAICN